MPDFFRGEPWTEEKMGDMQALIAWIGKVGAIEVVCFTLLGALSIICIHRPNVWYFRLLLKSSLLLNGFRVKALLRLALSVSAGVPRFVWEGGGVEEEQ